MAPVVSGMMSKGFLIIYTHYYNINKQVLIINSHRDSSKSLILLRRTKSGLCVWVAFLCTSFFRFFPDPLSYLEKYQGGSWKIGLLWSPGINSSITSNTLIRPPSHFDSLHI